MKCMVDYEDMAKAIPGLLPPGCTSTHEIDPDDAPDTLVRVVADNDTLTMQTPWGAATIPARIERRGVLFYALRHFYAAVARRYTGETEIDIDAEEDHLDLNGGRTFACFNPQAVFPDPATAPLTWAPPPPSDDDEDDWDDGREDSAEPAATESPEEGNP